MTRRSQLSGSLLPGLVVIGLVCLCGIGPALAQKSPFGVSLPEQTLPGAPGGVMAWIVSKTAQFHQQLIAALKQARDNGTAAWWLMVLSFAYGVFHAAGPGHGKAVIGSYLFASTRALKRGIGLSFAFALVQALSAIGLVTLLTAILNTTAATMDQSTLVLAVASNGLVVVIGLWLLLRKGKALWAVVALKAGWKSVAVHVHDAQCGHVPLASDAEAGGRFSLLAIILSGLRPCTGALFVLVFAWQQGMYGAGIAATFMMALGTACTISLIASIAVLAKGLAVRMAAPDSFAAVLALRCAETMVAACIVVLGLAMLAGALNGQIV